MSESTFTHERGILVFRNFSSQLLNTAIIFKEEYKLTFKEIIIKKAILKTSNLSYYILLIFMLLIIYM